MKRLFSNFKSSELINFKFELKSVKMFYKAYEIDNIITNGVSIPPTIVIPRNALLLGISTWETSPSRIGSRVIPEKVLIELY